jgi:hypothetical protein
MVALRIIAGAGGSGMNPQVLSSPDLPAIDNGRLDRYTGPHSYRRISPPDPQVFAGLRLSTTRHLPPVYHYHGGNYVLKSNLTYPSATTGPASSVSGVLINRAGDHRLKRLYAYRERQFLFRPGGDCHNGA